VFEQGTDGFNDCTSQVLNPTFEQDLKLYIFHSLIQGAAAIYFGTALLTITIVGVITSVIGTPLALMSGLFMGSGAELLGAWAGHLLTLSVRRVLMATTFRTTMVQASAILARSEAAIARISAMLQICGTAACLGWSRGQQMTSAQNLLRQWQLYGSDFQQAKNVGDYLSMASTFLRSPPAGARSGVRANGDVVRWHPETNYFGIMDKFGKPKTFFIPRPGPGGHGYPTNEAYFNAQVTAPG